VEWEPAVRLSPSCVDASRQQTLLLVSLLIKLRHDAVELPLPSLTGIMENPLIIQGINPALSVVDFAGKSAEIEVVLGWAEWGLPVLTDSPVAFPLPRS